MALAKTDANQNEFQNEWLLDVELSNFEMEHYCFCPLQGGEAVIGLTVLAEEPPGRFAGLLHGMGPEALNEWVEQNQDKVQELQNRWNAESV